MKIAVLTPLPPVKSGIAHYSATLLPELARRHDVTAVVDQAEVVSDIGPWMTYESFERNAAAFDTVICQLGNNVHHEFVWNWARRNPSIVVLHEIVLHHLLVETTLARGKVEAFTEALRSEYGDAGADVALARAGGLHGELENFLLPASGCLAESSRHVIVHNEWAASRLRAEGVSTPISVVPHPFEFPPRFDDREIGAVRQAHGWGETDTVVGVFGFVTHAKRPEVVMEAFSRAARTRPGLRLAFVGEAASNVDLRDMASRFGISDSVWSTTGYVTDREFDLWLNVVDRVVSLRYPTAGESSGAIVRAFAVGRPIAVSDYAQFAEFPRGLTVGIPFDDEVGAVARFMASDVPTSAEIAAPQRTWLESTSTVRHTVDGYERALGAARDRVATHAPAARIPLHPRLDAEVDRVERLDDRTRIVLRLTNRGPGVVACAVWGEPYYLLHVRLIGARGARHDDTRHLGQDLRAGETTFVEIDSPISTLERVELRHAISGVPDVEAGPFALLELTQ